MKGSRPLPFKPSPHGEGVMRSMTDEVVLKQDVSYFMKKKEKAKDIFTSGEGRGVKGKDPSIPNS